MQAQSIDALIAYWQSKCGDTGIPDRADIDPTEIPRLLQDIIILERTDDANLRVRLAGTNVVSCLDYDPTGQVFDRNMVAKGVQALIQHCGDAANLRKPQRHVIDNFGLRRAYNEVELAILPLRRNGDDVVMFLIGAHFRVSSARDKQELVARIGEKRGNGGHGNVVC